MQMTVGNTGRSWRERLSHLNQTHLFDESTEEQFQNIEAQLDRVDKSYIGGLERYVAKSQLLLAECKTGVNTFADYSPSQPPAVNVEVGDDQFFQFEEAGEDCLRKCVFVLVAGGLGERLQYAEPKISLLTNVTCEISYIEYYIRTILKIQSDAQENGHGPLKLPLLIMTSQDTHTKTVDFLRENSYFRADPQQIRVIQQELVPALTDFQARLAVSPATHNLILKPHGHGDVHSLIFTHSLTDIWLKQGLEWCFFFQDTNALSVRALATLLGVSKLNDFHFNSLCVPRLPCEAVGAICQLDSKTNKKSMTVNVEYNLLDTLLRDAGLGGDVASPGTKYSPFPGNCNILALKLVPYSKVLKDSKGEVPEFVNPKFTSSEKTSLKTPTRLECMMQDFARLYDTSKIGCTVLDRWFCFSTVKNGHQTAIERLAANNSPECAFSAEADLYDSNVKCLKVACQRLSIPFEASEPCEVIFAGVKYPMGPKVYLDPTYGFSISQIISQLKRGGTSEIKLGAKTSLSLSGSVHFKSLDLNGTLSLSTNSGGVCSLGDVRVDNDGVQIDPVDVNNPEIPLKYRVRGYRPVGAVPR